jgi:hypothetical protein
MVMNSRLLATKSGTSVVLPHCPGPVSITTGVSLSARQSGRKARKERVIGIVPAGWKLRLIRIKVASISDYRLV